MKKVVVVGCSGSGKSTFSKKLSELLLIPVYHLDNIWWNNDKTHITRDEFDIKLDAILKKDMWIIDGDYSRTYEVRMKEADTIFFLDYPLQLCLDGVSNRVGKVRDDIPWIEDSFDEEFKEWIISWKDRTLPQLEYLLDKYKDKANIIRFHSREEADEYLSKIKRDI